MIYIKVYQHISVGFGVARFDKLGDARASERGTSDKDNSHALFVYMPDLNRICLCWGVSRKRKLTMETEETQKEIFDHMDKLYHFTSYKSARSILASLRLRFGKLNKSNDICERAKFICNNFSGLGNDVEIKDIKNEIYRYQQISFTKDKRTFCKNSFTLQQMWGEYAHNGYGVCLVFDKKALIKTLFVKECHYRAIKYEKSFSQCLELAAINKSTLREYIKDNARRIFFAKGKEWEHEQEFRVICRFPNQKQDHYVNINDSLRYVIVFHASDIDYWENIENSRLFQDLRTACPEGVRLLRYAEGLNGRCLVDRTEETETLQIIWQE